VSTWAKSRKPTFGRLSSAEAAFNLLAARPKPTGLEVEQAMTKDDEFVNWLATGYSRQRRIIGSRQRTNIGSNGHEVAA